MIEVKNLVKRYEDVLALDHFHLEVKEGEVLGLLGTNGSGKTTAIHCMLSLLQYDKGSIYIFDKPMDAYSYDSKHKIGVVFQDMAVFDDLTVKENIDYFCSLYIKDKKTRQQYVVDALKFTGLELYVNFFPHKLSGGLLRRLNIACGIVHKPKLLFMDEPTVAVDPQSRNTILQGILELNKQGTTIVYTSHYMEEVEQICSRIVIMDKGKVITQGTKEELKERIAMKEKIIVEEADITKEQLEQLLELPYILDYKVYAHKIELYFGNKKSQLSSVVFFLQEHQIMYQGLYQQLPTLNDVFLEFTGKQLRD